jgi:chromate transporter
MMEKRRSDLTFLKDVFICSLGAFGGPEAHYGVFTDHMVIKKKYLTEEEMIELIALTGLLPGPSSTQTMLAIGYKVGGPRLLFLTLLVWATPAILLMTLFSFLYAFLSYEGIDQNILRYIGPMAVGFMAVASYKLGRKVIKNGLTLSLFLVTMVITYFISQSFIYPLVLITGGLITLIASKEKNLWHRVSVKPKWIYLILVVGIAVISFGLTLIFDNRLIFLFERFYRFGYLVIGGGQVVIPYMVTELVEVHQFLSMNAFLTGFGLVQGIPGPMFSFSAYAGGMASADLGVITHILGALISGIAIFLPGTLLILFVIPMWESIKQMKGIRIALSGTVSVAGGLITIAAVKLMQESGLSLDHIIVFVVTTILLLTKKVPAPLIVLLAILLGILI